MIDRRGHLIIEMNLFCAGRPQRRSKNYSNTVTDLDNQYEFINSLEPFREMLIDDLVIIDIEYYYRDIKEGMTYDVDNLIKATLDNLQRMKVIVNDRNVVGVSVYKLRAVDDHTVIRIYGMNGYLCSLFAHIKKKLSA